MVRIDRTGVDQNKIYLQDGSFVTVTDAATNEIKNALGIVIFGT
jgi:hypothetical protein